MIKPQQRECTDSVKWHKYAGQDILPMWIADTDFAAANEILDALRARIEHGVMGYGYATEDFKRAVVNHLYRQYNWSIDPEWICPIPGVVPGLNIARAITLLRGKSAAITLSPTYPHLRNNPRILDFYQQFVEVIPNNVRWDIDFSAIEQQASDKTGLLLLCHPHNPLGKIYTSNELHRFAELAKERDWLVCSDEIHCDLILNGTQHRPFATLTEDTLQRSITLMAPSKTFNIAGLCCAFAVIANPSLRQEFRTRCAGLTGDVNILGMVAATAAFKYGCEWHEAMIAVLRDNAAKVYQRVNAMPYLQMAPVEATFLAWIDARALPIIHPQRFFEDAGVGLADGKDYGWPGYVRLNFGCGAEMLENALSRMEQALTNV